MKYSNTSEAGKIEFGHRPELESQSVVLGSFFIREDRGIMYLNLHSLERLLAAIPFFDTHLPRKAARLHYFSLVNRLFALTEYDGFSFDEYFDADMEFHDPSEHLLQRIKAISKGPTKRHSVSCTSHCDSFPQR